MAQARQQHRANVLERDVGSSSKKRPGFGGQNQALQPSRAGAIQDEFLRHSSAVALLFLRMGTENNPHRIIFDNFGQRDVPDPLPHLQNRRTIDNLAQRAKRRGGRQFGYAAKFRMRWKFQYQLEEEAIYLSFRER